MKSFSKSNFKRNYQTHLRLKALKPYAIYDKSRAMRCMVEYFNHRINDFSTKKLMPNSCQTIFYTRHSKDYFERNRTTPERCGKVLESPHGLISIKALGIHLAVGMGCARRTPGISLKGHHHSDRINYLKALCRKLGLGWVVASRLFNRL